MSLPAKEANGVFTHVYPVADLGLSSTLASGASDTGTPFSTGVPGTVVLISKMTTAGTGATITIDRAATAAAINHSSPDVTLSISGTDRQVAALDTTSSELFVGIEQYGGTAATPVWAELAVLVLYELTAGEEWYNIRSAINCVASEELGDGSGVVTLTVA